MTEATAHPKHKIEQLDVYGQWRPYWEGDDAFEYMSKSGKMGMSGESMRITLIGAKGHEPDTRKLDELTIDSVVADPSLDMTLRSSTQLGLRTPGVMTTQKHEIKPTPAQPSIGRIVHYYQGSLKRVVPAIVTEIGEIPKGSQIADVKLHVFWAGGPEDRSQGGWYTYRDEYTSGCWSWPPRG